MKFHFLRLAMAFLAFLAFRTSGAVHYVSLNSTNPVPPYAGWGTAATNIQDAVDASTNGDLILVTNGVYSSGGRLSDDGTTNCVVVTNAVTVQSVKGPLVTLIDGGSLLRCAFLTNGAAMSGFTLTNGNAGNGGGVFGGTLTNCLIVGNNGGGVYYSVLNYCTVVSNNAIGAGYSTLNNCVISGNNGSGAGGCTLNYCVISNNISGYDGGGANICTLNNCFLSGNTAVYGGGASSSTLNNCALTGNTAEWGGGTISSTLNNCLVAGNVAHNHYHDYYSASLGGGTWGGMANNCTIVGNNVTADENSSGLYYSGGGAYGTALNNCIIQFNSESPYNHDSTYNYGSSSLSNCCTSPLPGSGSGNIASDPLFVNFNAGDYHLQTNSPCISAGNNAFVVGTNDLDGNPRIVGLIVDMGAYEFQTPTYFTVQPQSQFVNVGQTAIFSASATGPYPVVYQWYFNGSAIARATNTTLVLTNVTATNDGTYFATASNATVTAYSFNATLTVVYPPPGIVSQPTNLTILTGSNAALSVTATNDITMTYQWLFGGTNLTDGGNVTGSTSSNLVITAATTNNAGTYQVIVANAFGSVTSSVATLTVLVPAAITLQPVSQTVLWTSNLVFATTAIGTAPLNYQWYFNGAPMADGGRVSGSMSDSLNIVNVQTNDAGSYQLVVTNNYGSDTSAVAVLTVFYWQPAAITTQPTNLTVVLTSNAVFAVTATGTTNLAYQWYFNDAPLAEGGRVSGSTNATLNIGNVQTNDAGNYQVIVTNGFGSATSAVATLTVLVPAQITGQPASEAVLLTSNSSFSVTAVGTSLSYQWYFKGNVMSDSGRISGTTAASLSISNVQSSDAGSYQVVVSNLLNVATSAVVALTPLTGPGPSVRYVNLNNPTPASPYLDWSTAATNIQDAVDAAVSGDLILVTNGVYQTGGRVVYGSLTNRVVIYKAVTVQSVNGPGVTTISGFPNNGSGIPTNGNNAVRCVYLTNNAALAGFTLAFGATRSLGDLNREQSGGGAWCEGTNALLSNCILTTNSAQYFGGGVNSGTLTNCFLTRNKITSGGGGGANGSFLINCTLAGNIATNSEGSGGGAREATLNNCWITNNHAVAGGGVDNCIVNNCLLAGNGDTNLTSGGAAYLGTLNNCTLVGNYSRGLGAADGSTLNNSIIYYNSNNGYADCYQCRLTNCCTTIGLGNGSLPNNSFSNAPVFVNLAGADYHLQSNSPCINGGTNLHAFGATDLDGNPRIVGGAVDMGAYEYQTPGFTLPYLWAKKYGISTDGSLDSDGDGLNNWQEWRAGTNPTNALSVLKMASTMPTNSPPGMIVTWQSVGGVIYFLQSSTHLGMQPAFSTTQSNIIGQAGTTSYTDTTATNGGPYFYRVGVQ